MHETDVYMEGLRHSFIGLVVWRSSAIVMDGILVPRILSDSGLKGFKPSFW